MENDNLAKTLEWVRNLEEMEAIVPDGSWSKRFLGRLTNSDPKVAGEAAMEAVSDHEVYLPASVVAFLCFAPSINRAAAAAALRVVWIDQGFGTNPEVLGRIFREAAASAPNYLMNDQEWAVMAALPEVVTVYRGQLFNAGKKPTGASWTLLKEVAQWYSAPTADSRKRGWVLAAKIPKSAILALFFERGEKEVVIDVAQLQPSSVDAQRGTCDKFPLQLTKSKLGFMGSLSSIFASKKVNVHFIH